MSFRTLIAAAAVCIVSGPALAAGGGGGGSSVPSATGPSYDPVIEYQAGVEYLRAKDYAKAERAFKRVIDVAKTDANSHYLLGITHQEQAEWKQAVRAHKNAVRFNPDLHDARGRLGAVYIQLGDLEKADEQLAELAAAKTACAGSCAASADIELALARIEAAKTSPADGPGDVSANGEILQLASADGAYLGAVRRINLGDYDGAKVELQAVLTAVGPNPDVLTYLGFANRKQGNFETALSFYTAALSVDPAHLNAQEYLGEYYVERGDLGAARAQLSRINALCPFGCSQSIELQKWIDGARS
jgi:tetratricopeptide (TPR) repeat protein